MTVFERRPYGHIRLEISPALLRVWVDFQGQTDCLQLGNVPSHINASQLRTRNTGSFLSNSTLTHNTQ